MYLIKLLPITIGIGAISTGMFGGMANNAHHPSTLQRNDPFVTWATTAKKDAVNSDIPALLKSAPVSDWKLSDQIHILSSNINIWKADVNITLQDNMWGMHAVISDQWLGQIYNINQWKCSLEPSDTNAHLWFENWYTGWNDFSKLDVRTRLEIIVTQWYNDQLDHDPMNSRIKNGVMGAAGLGVWKGIINNVTIEGNTIYFNLRINPGLSGSYWYTNSASVSFDNNRKYKSFSTSDINPIGDWIIHKF